jgi:hypothetical protein
MAACGLCRLPGSVIFSGTGIFYLVKREGQRSENRDQGSGNREQGTGNREQ